MRKSGLRLVALLLCCVLGVVSVVAQDVNLLVNPSLDESGSTYAQRRGGDKPIYVAQGWNYWIAAQIDAYTNNPNEVVMFPHPGPIPNVLDGNRAQFVECAYATCTVAILQQVGNVQVGSNVQARASSQVKACNFIEPATSCGSAVESGSKTRIGIDPNGGTDPNDADIVWSGYVQPHDQWLEQSVSATATGTSVTVFLYSTQSSKARLNRTYWDKAFLGGGGTGGAAAGATPATPVPTVPPVVAFVVPQNAQGDGSIVHTVQAGDTIDSIAYAYGVGRSAILELNKITDPRLIYVGQKLTIKAASPGGIGNQPTAAPTSADAAAQPTTDAASAVQPTTDAAAAPPATEDAAAQAVQPTTAPVEPTAETPAQPTPADAAAQPTTEPLPATAVPAELPPPQPNSLPTAPVEVADAASAIDPLAQTATVCVIFFEDADQNRLQEQGEGSLAGGAVRLLLGGEAVGEYVSDGAAKPKCFDSLAAGDYVASAGAPQGYGLTTPDQLRLRLNPGAKIDITFGAAQGVQPPALPAPEAGAAAEVTPVAPVAAPSITNQILSMSGLLVFGLAVVVLVGGVGVAFLVRRR
jgi:LysM repeat protein